MNRLPFFQVVSKRYYHFVFDSHQRKAGRFYPTRLAVNMSCIGRKIHLDTDKHKTGFIVLETNYRLYAYTDSGEFLNNFINIWSCVVEWFAYWTILQFVFRSATSISEDVHRIFISFPQSRCWINFQRFYPTSFKKWNFSRTNNFVSKNARSYRNG